MALDAAPTNSVQSLPRFLTFHKLGSGHFLDSTSYSLARFETLLRFLIESEFTLSSDNISSANDKSQSIAMSFDDGYAHLTDLLPPLMQKHNFRPIIFMPTMYIGQSNNWDYSHSFHSEPHLSAKQISYLAGEGVIFGSHGHSHTNLCSINPDDLKSELTISREILQELTNQPIDMISYPFGRVNDAVWTLTETAGYKHGFTMAFPSENDKPMVVGRIAIYRFDGLASIKRKLRLSKGYRFERSKAAFINRLAGGTILLNHLRSTKLPTQKG